jgi:ABC-type transporter Mla subunit MlaD
VFLVAGGALLDRLVGMPREALAVAVAGPQAAADLWAAVQRLVDRASAALDRIEALLDHVETRVEDVGVVTERTRRVLDAASGTSAEADRLVAGALRSSRSADHLLERLRALLDLYEPLLRRTGSIAHEAGTRLQPTHLRGLVALLDELPRVVQDLEPALKGMAGVGGMVPELEEVAERMDNVGQIVEGVPGAKMLRRRGQRREAAEE